MTHDKSDKDNRRNEAVLPLRRRRVQEMVYRTLDTVQDLRRTGRAASLYSPAITATAKKEGCNVNDKCRQEFEKWVNGRFSPLDVTHMIHDRYTRTWVDDCWQGWQAAWKASPPPVTRDGWLTEGQIEYISEINSHCEPGVNEVVALCNMASAAISLHSERTALVAQLRGVIDTIERGNV